MIGGVNVVSLLIGLVLLYLVAAKLLHLSTTLIIVLEVVAFLVFLGANLAWGSRSRR